MNVKIVPVVLCFLFLLGACSVPKNVTYFQGIDKLTPEQLEAMSQDYSTRIGADDMLTITVTGWDTKATTPFNPPTYTYSENDSDEELLVTSQNLYTYLVDKEGYIEFPLIGKVYAKGLSKKELSDKLQKEIAEYVEKPLVKVQIINFKINLVGDVNRPGQLTIKTDRISIVDAISQAGDLTINADRENILVIRDNDGQIEYGRVNLTDASVFASPYYYLKQNDVVYIEPNDAKKRNANYSQAQQYTVTVFSSILSAISVITTVIVAISK